MPRRIAAFLAGVLTVSFIALASCTGGDGGGGDDGTATPEATPAPAGPTSTSDDGKLSLFVPEGAMPEGTNVSARAVPLEQLPPELATLRGAGTGYRLEPDGLTFSQSVTATLTIDRAELDDPEGTQSAYALVSFNETAGRDALDSTTTATVGESTVTVSAEIEHFSYITRTKGSLMVQLDGVPSIGVVPYVIPVGANVTNTARETVTLNPLLFEWLEFRPVVYDDPISPSRLRNDPGFAEELNQVQNNFKAFYRANFRCERVGAGGIGARIEAVSTLNDLPGAGTRLTVSIDSRVECVSSAAATQTAAAPTATATTVPLGGYKVSQSAGCRHNGPGDSSHLTLIVLEDQSGGAVQNALVSLQVDGPGLVSPAGQPVTTLTTEGTTNAQGEAVIESPITRFGDYISKLLGITLADGTAATIDPTSTTEATYTVGPTCTPP